MESLSRKHHIDSTRQSSFQTLALNNVNSTSKTSANLNVTTPFLSYAEVLNASYRPTMVSTTSTPTPSSQTSSFYLLRDDTREFTQLFLHLWLIHSWCLITYHYISDFIAATPSETNSNLLVKHGFDQTYQKSKKVKESLSSFLPHLPGKASCVMCEICLFNYCIQYRPKQLLFYIGFSNFAHRQ